MSWATTRQQDVDAERAMHQIYELSHFSMGSDSIAIENTIEVLAYLSKKFEQNSNSGSPNLAKRAESKDASKGGGKEEFAKSYQAQRSAKPNSSDKSRWPESSLPFQILRLTHERLERHKEEWVADYRAKRRNLDNERVISWFTEEKNDYALRRDSSYVVALLRVSFNYRYVDLETIFGLVNSKRSLDKHIFRKRKKSLIDHFIQGTTTHPKHWLGDFVKVKDDEDEAESLTETNPAFPPGKRFVSQQLTEEKFRIVKETLANWTPLQPNLDIPDKIAQGSLDLGPEGEDDLEEWVQTQVNSSSEDEVERGRVIALKSNLFLSGVLKALKLEPLDQKAEIADFSLQDWSDSQGTPPVSPAPPLSPSQTQNIKIALKVITVRRRDYSQRSVTVEGGRNNFLLITLDEPKTVQLKLKPGDDMIRVTGRDEYGVLPLDVHFLSVADFGYQDEKYVTVLDDRRKLEFNVSCQTDALGEVTGALVDINYSCTPYKQPIVSRLIESASSLMQWGRMETAKLAWATLSATAVALAVMSLMSSLLVTGGQVGAISAGQTSNQNSSSSDGGKVNPATKNGAGRREQSVKAFAARSGGRPRQGGAAGLFLFTEKAPALKELVENNGEWHFAVKSRPESIAAVIKGVKVSATERATGNDIEISQSADGRITLPVAREGVYDLTVERRGIHFFGTVEMPLNGKPYVELRKGSDR